MSTGLNANLRLYGGRGSMPRISRGYREILDKNATARTKHEEPHSPGLVLLTGRCELNVLHKPSMTLSAYNSDSWVQITAKWRDWPRRMNALRIRPVPSHLEGLARIR